jgi:hypothetical protein
MIRPFFFFGHRKNVSLTIRVAHLQSLQVMGNTLDNVAAGIAACEANKVSATPFSAAAFCFPF